MNLSKENTKKIKGLILFTVLILVLLWNYKALFSVIRIMGNAIFPFLLGGAIAFVLNVPMSFVEKKLFGKAKQKDLKWTVRLARPVSFIVTLIIVISIIGIAIWGIVPELGRSIMNLGTTLQKVVPEMKDWLIEIFKDNTTMVEKIRGLKFEWNKIMGQILLFLKGGSKNVIDTTYEAAKSIVSGITTFFVAFVFSCYILIQKEKLNLQVKKLMYAFMPKDWTEILLALGTVTYKSFSSFLTGQCLEAIILGALFLVAMSIFQLPYALLISVLIAFTALIPVFGAFLGCGVGILLIFIVEPEKVLVFLILFVILQQIEGNFIYPHVVGSSVGLPSIWVLVAVSVGASLMGIVGMLVFIPIVSIVYTMLRGIVARRLKEKDIEV